VKLHHRLCLNLVLLTAVVGSSVTTAQSKYYSWQDADGNEVLSDQPPTDGTAYETHQPSTFNQAELPQDQADSPASGTDTGGGTPATGTNFQKDPEQCEIARKNLDVLTNNEKVKTLDEKTGKERYVTPEEITVWRETARAKIEVYCQ